MLNANLKNARILLVDDQQANLLVLESILERHAFTTFKSITDSRQVLAQFDEFQPDLILLDLHMPYLDGFVVLEQLQQRIAPNEYLPILLLTADSTPEAKLRALASGARDFLAKPLDLAETILRIHNLLETRSLHQQLQNQNTRLEEKVAERTAALQAREKDLAQSNLELTEAYETTIEGWSNALDLRDKETEGHSQRVTAMTVNLARAAGMNETELAHVRRGALLHDIGKMGVPDAILLKPDKLTDEEWVIMRKHPAFAFELLSPIRYLRPALDIPYCHHEKWDGSGYPRGLKEEDIPFPARIFAVVDVWDALRSDRPYRKGWTPEKVREHIQSQAGMHFDPHIVELFMQLLEEITHEHA